MNLGPFHITNEVSLGSILTIITIIWTALKYFSHIVTDYKVRSERLDKIWLKFYGNYEDDPDGWFKRLELMEQHVNEMWKRLKFNRLSFDDTQRTRHTD